MKWNIIILSLVLTLGLSTQSYGFELLDLMLGLKGCGCEVKSCETKGHKKCGAEKNGCDSKKKCHRSLLGHLGCDAKDKCGTDKDGCDTKKRCHGSLLGHLGCDAKKSCDGKKGHHKKNTSKNTAEPKGKPVRVERTKKCGKEKTKKECGCVLSQILSLGHGCDKKACDRKKHDKCGAGHKKRGACDAKDKAESSAEATSPTPPAPVVDPSALLPSQRRVVHTSLNTTR